jgi:hypothetical protein
MDLKRLPIRRIGDEVIVVDGDTPFLVLNPEDIPEGVQDGIFTINRQRWAVRYESRHRDSTKGIDIEVMMNPEAHGLTQCPHCNGYGSSLKETADRCTFCGGTGLVLIEKAKTYKGET